MTLDRLTSLGQISLLTGSADAAEAWYRDVLRMTFLYRYGGLVFFDCGGVRLFIREVPAEEWRPSSTLYFVVRDIEAVHADLASRGVEFAEPPALVHRHEASGVEEWMAFFKDPDGNMLAIMSSVAGPAEPSV